MTMESVITLWPEFTIAIGGAAFVGLCQAAYRRARRNNGPRSVKFTRNGKGIPGYRIRDLKTEAMSPLSDEAGKTLVPKVCATKVWVDVLDRKDHVILRAHELGFSRTRDEDIELP